MWDVEEMFRKYLLPFEKEIENNFNNLRTDLTRFAEENKALKKIIVQLEERINKIELNSKTNADSSSSNSIIAELNDRKSRESNLIAYDVPESKKHDGPDRLVDDHNLITTMTTFLNNVENLTFKSDLTPAQQNHLRELRSELNIMGEM